MIAMAAFRGLQNFQVMDMGIVGRRKEDRRLDCGELCIEGWTKEERRTELIQGNKEERKDP